MLLFTTKQDSYFKFLDWILYLCFCGLSAFFMREVLEKFISGKTSFAQSEEPSKELPTITLCFSNPDSIKTTYEYGLDFKIKYTLKARNIETSTFLIEGTNMTVLKEIVSLNKFISETLGNCYKFSHIFFKVMDYQYSNLLVHFDNSVILPDTTKLKLFLTSEINVYGLAINQWKNGKVAKIEISKGFYETVDVQTHKSLYLPGKSNCTNVSFYECISRIYEINEMKCLPGTYPSYLPVCKETNGKYWDKFWYVWDEVTKNGQCPKLCKKIEYFAEPVGSMKVKKFDPKAMFGFSLTFESLNFMTLVNEEYLIYDTTSMIGSVGGTLGMCIGFSFTGVMSILTNFLNNGITIMKHKWKTVNSKTSLDVKKTDFRNHFTKADISEIN